MLLDFKFTNIIHIGVKHSNSAKLFFRKFSMLILNDIFIHKGVFNFSVLPAQIRIRHMKLG